MRRRIPTSHNPFHYYDKAIISIYTLKQDAEYGTFETAIAGCLTRMWWCRG